MNLASPTGRVIRETVITIAAYLVGLAVILFVDLPEGRWSSLAIGAAVMFVVYAVLKWRLIGFRPAAEHEARSPRYAVPNFIAFALALVWTALPSDATTPDYSLYAVVIPILIAGQFVSNFWWALHRQPADAPG